MTSLLPAKSPAASRTSGNWATHGPQLSPQKSTSTTLPARFGAAILPAASSEASGSIGGAGWLSFTGRTNGWNRLGSA